MKNITILILLSLSLVACKTQIVPLENQIDYSGDIPDGTYFKDVNNHLDKYLGTWTGNYNNKSFTLYLTKETSSFLNISIDEIYLRYKIMDANGNIMVDTSGLNNDSTQIVRGKYLSADLTNYFFKYIGQDSTCGQLGDFVISTLNNDTQFNFFYRKEGVTYTEDMCPNGSAPQIFPIETPVIFTKQ